MTHTHLFTHEFEEGPSGPARSYWEIRRGTRTLGTVCLGPRSAFALLHVQSICHMLDGAYQAGRVAKATEVREVLGVRP